MKLLWLCNMAPSAVKENITGKAGGSGLWVDHVLKDLRTQKDLHIRILCPNPQPFSGELDPQCSYATYTEGLPYVYLPQLETQFLRELEEYRPDVIHIWGSEYGHTLAMVNAACQAGMQDKAVISIQGLCSVYAGHYAEGVPHRIQAGFTFRDLVRRDNILQQQKKFALRGDLEEQALNKVRHVIGRTPWDKACARRVNPDAQYHFCNETLRPDFYSGSWNYADCQKHRIFASSCAYPVKGFHYLLQALAEVIKVYPDAVLAVPGKNILEDSGIKAKLRRDSYQKYLLALIAQYQLREHLQFLGSLSAAQMKEQYLKANVFALPSTIENSPNSLGEAMLLGVPCVASDVGGVADLLVHGEEGFVYQSTAPYMLAHYIMQVFALEDQAKTMAQAGAQHAAKTHDPAENLKTLLDCYRSIAGKE